MKKVGILAFTDNGRQLAEKLKKQLGAEAEFTEPDEKTGTKEFVRAGFDKLDTFIFISAAGIAVRMIAPFIKSKDTDPAVIVMDELGQFVIPVLSGHLGGANEAAKRIAELTGGTCVLTTATDINGKFAVDSWACRAGCVIDNISNIKHISAEILKGNKVSLYTEFPVEGNVPEELTKDKRKKGIAVSIDGLAAPFDRTLNVIPKIVTVGVGCRKNTPAGDFEKFLLDTLAANHIALSAVEKLASIDLKKEEECILKFSEKYNIPFETYTAEELSEAEGDFAASDFVKKTTGVDNVCERSACLGAGQGKIILKKNSRDGMTVAASVRDWKCEF